MKGPVWKVYLLYDSRDTTTGRATTMETVEWSSVPGAEGGRDKKAEHRGCWGQWKWLDDIKIVDTGHYTFAKTHRMNTKSEPSHQLWTPVNNNKCHHFLFTLKDLDRLFFLTLCEVAACQPFLATENICKFRSLSLPKIKACNSSNIEIFQVLPLEAASNLRVHAMLWPQPVSWNVPL